MSFQDRQSVRYDLAQPELMFSTVCTEGSATPIDMRLNNISVGGLQFVAQGRLRKGESIRVCLRVDGKLVVDARAIVRWSIIDGQGWVAGCQFEQLLSPAVLDDLAEAGVLERRKHFRIPVLLEAMIAFEGSPEQQACRIMDYSNGGVCIQIDASATPGQKARVSVSDAGEKAQVYVLIRWVDVGKKLLGLEFLREDDRDAFLNCVELMV